MIDEYQNLLQGEIQKEKEDLMEKILEITTKIEE